MADRIVQLIDGRNNDNIYPVSINDAPIITVTSTDPGAGSSLATNHFVAVTGTQSTVGAVDLASNSVTTPKIADGSVTADKVDLSSFALPVFIGSAGIVKQTYNNANLKLQNLNTLYAANGISSSIVDTTNWTFVLPSSGTYVVEIYASLWSGTNSWDYMLVEARINNVGIARAMAPKIPGSWGFVNCQGLGNISNGQAITVYLNTSGNNFSDGNMSDRDSHVLVKIYRTA